MQPLTVEEFVAASSVSRETLARLEAHLRLLTLWQSRLNLVGSKTLADPWRRHYLDSAQLEPLLPVVAHRTVDLGSGAGFPGLVLAAMGVPDVHLVESDTRKVAFLREAARSMDVRVSIHARRIERLAPLQADVVTARALAPLDSLLRLATPVGGARATYILPKGRQVAAELTVARARWHMKAELVPSLTDPEGRIVVLREVRRVEPK